VRARRARAVVAARLTDPNRDEAADDPYRTEGAIVSESVR